jgi:HD-like signal output (HDOD) protein
MRRILCVHDDPAALENMRRALLERERDWDVRLCRDEESASAELQSWAPDVVCAAVRPPQLDGIVLLTRVRDRSPETIRVAIGALEKEEIMRAHRIAHRAVPDGCEPDTFVETIRRPLLLRELVGQSPVRALLGKVGQLPAVPHVYAELTRRLADPRVTVGELGDLVEKDTALAAQVLRIANSAYFGRDRAVANLGDAAARLGTRLLRSLVLTAEVYGGFAIAPRFVAYADELQKHASLVARLASSLEPRTAWAEDAFTGGLLHDIGKLVLLARAPELFDELLREAESSRRDLHVVEAERLGVHHGTLGACVLGMWGLPSAILEAVLGHQEPPTELPRALQPAQAVSIANRLAHDAMDGEAAKVRRAPLTVAVLTDPRWQWWREMADQLVLEGVEV